MEGMCTLKKPEKKTASSQPLLHDELDRVAGGFVTTKPVDKADMLGLKLGGSIKGYEAIWDFSKKAGG